MRLEEHLNLINEGFKINGSYIQLSSLLFTNLYMANNNYPSWIYLTVNSAAILGSLPQLIDGIYEAYTNKDIL